MAEYEQHFNELQAGIRARASTWLLAAFAAIAVLIKTSGGTEYIVPPSVLINTAIAAYKVDSTVGWGEARTPTNNRR